jgi:hypothetical protein
LLAVKAPVDFEPLVATDPLQAPEAVQAVASVEDQVNVEPPPLDTLLGLALSDTLGGVADVVTVADCDAEPAAPVHVIVYFVVAERADVVFEPRVATVPLQPPEAAQDVVFADDQVNVDVAPLLTVLGFAERVTVGAARLTETVVDCAALPPAPVQVIPKVLLAVSAPVDCEPLTALLPDQAPEAVQEVALAADQVNVELLPVVTVLGFAAMVTVGAGAVTETVEDCVALPPLPVQVSP